MLHGPCGFHSKNRTKNINKISPCEVDGICTKKYPRPFNESTSENENGYPVYRRSDNGATYTSPDGFVFDNRWVVPYNKYLCRKYNAHINVEICTTVSSVKYLYKYVYKGKLLINHY